MPLRLSIQYQMGFGDGGGSRAISRICFSEKGSSSCSLFFLIRIGHVDSLLGLLPILLTLSTPSNVLQCLRIAPWPSMRASVVSLSAALCSTAICSFLMLPSISILTWILPLGYFLHEPQASMWQLSFIVYVPCITQASVWILPNGFSHNNLVSASLVNKLIADNIFYTLKMFPHSTQCPVTTQAIASNYFKPTSTKFSPQHNIY